MYSNWQSCIIYSHANKAVFKFEIDTDRQIDLKQTMLYIKSTKIFSL